MNILCNIAPKLRNRPEGYTCTTVRYPAPKGFAEFYKNNVLKPKICRTFITIDELWDYKTNEFSWNYEIGVHKVDYSDRYYPYDWFRVRPTGVKFLDYIKENSLNSDEILLSIGRYERELFDGIIPQKQYEDAVYKIIEYYKELCPNIVYIEPCNEPEAYSFGGLSMDEVIRLYRIMGGIVKKLNERHNYEKPLKFGGIALSCGYDRWDNWQSYLEGLAEIPEIERLIDFYSFHIYTKDMCEAELYTLRHRQLLEKLGLPDKPIFVDEMGFWFDTSVKEENLKNAVGTVSQMLNIGRLDNVYAFPWCEWHNPDIQVAFSQIISNNGELIFTPFAFGMQMLCMLNDYELKVDCNRHFNYIATSNKDLTELTLLYCNTYDVVRTATAALCDLPDGSYNVTEYTVDTVHNNCFTGEYTGTLEPSDAFLLEKVNEIHTISKKCTPYSLTLWKITKRD